MGMAGLTLPASGRAFSATLTALRVFFVFKAVVGVAVAAVRGLSRTTQARGATRPFSSTWWPRCSFSVPHSCTTAPIRTVSFLSSSTSSFGQKTLCKCWCRFCENWFSLLCLVFGVVFLFGSVVVVRVGR